MPPDLDCAAELNLALSHIEMGSYKIAMTMLQKYRGCHERHQTCPYKGDACAVQDVIDGFCAEMKAANKNP